MVAGCMGASVQTYGHAHIVTGSVRLKSNYEGCCVKVPGNFESRIGVRKSRGQPRIGCPTYAKLMWDIRAKLEPHFVSIVARSIEADFSASL